MQSVCSLRAATGGDCLLPHIGRSTPGWSLPRRPPGRRPGASPRV